MNNRDKNKSNLCRMDITALIGLIKEQNKRISEYERFVNYLLVVLGTGKDRLELRFHDELTPRAHSVCNLLRGYFDKMGIEKVDSKGDDSEGSV